MTINNHRLYKYDGWLFESYDWFGPWPLKKGGEPRKNAGRKFWKMWEKFEGLSEDDREQFLDGGG